jgi:hypothetical protein
MFANNFRQVSEETFQVWRLLTTPDAFADAAFAESVRERLLCESGLAPMDACAGTTIF